MSTRAMICVDLSGNERCYELYYRHCDGYPTGLGAEIIEALLAGKSIEEVIEAVGAKEKHRTVSEPEEAFLKVQGDLEWIYVLRQVDGSLVGFEILKTSNPYTRRNFVWPVWFSYSKYLRKKHLKHMEMVEHNASTTLHALDAFENAKYGTGYCTKCGEKIEWSGTGWGKNDSDQCAECFDRENNALGPEQSDAGEPEVQTCNECGNSVAPGSGRFVNRIPDFNKPAYRKEMGKPFPEGDYVCAECDQGEEVIT